jgi:CRP/FNR family transcriptional regulator, cyclic AMP receptor protein
MVSASTDHLAAVPLFSALTKRDLQQVLQASDEIEVEPGRELITEGRVGHEFFLILEGQAEVGRNGERIATLGPGDYFGELALLDHGPRSATVIAETDMKLVVLGQREFAGLVETVPGLAAKLLPGLAHRLREVDADAFRY